MNAQIEKLFRPTPTAWRAGSNPSTFRLLPPFDSLFKQAGLTTFDDFWNLSQDFVEPINIRRGGWSGVTRLELQDEGTPQLFYVKRQQNQIRRTPSRPFGDTTYYFEAIAIRDVQQLQLPCVELAAYGSRRSGRDRQAILVTKGLESAPLAELCRTDPKDRDLVGILKLAGEQIFEMHRNRISHGALYPNHLYLDLKNRQVQLIDFERARKCLSPRHAIKRDLSQFLKRSAVLRESEINSFLARYLTEYPQLTRQLIEKCRAS